ncbi:potassium transporter KefB [Pontibacter cellulosilyticus]|uniref:Potassium transporter KefB n=1 Tax=Pontibacter cellulosilyticus TaxID=1720253 RepID=A0A923N617_9BACT|nr:potassium transporter KefB [Pontibacter cellulosilyticus]MBC5992397.1 potassium transporter KefB [Pontibacter cellulosilyticus]
MRTRTEQQHSLNYRGICRGALAGAGIALVLLLIFMLALEDIAYGVWVIIPMLTMSVGGALGGIYCCFMNHLRVEGSWAKAYANITSTLFYILLLWLSLVAGLHATGHWD